MEHDMANLLYFRGATQLTGIRHDGHWSSAARHFSGIDHNGNRVAAERVIERKAGASNHKCDARCLNATGRIMKCECSCGGKNHGRGHFACEPSA